MRIHLTFILVFTFSALMGQEPDALMKEGKDQLARNANDSAIASLEKAAKGFLATGRDSMYAEAQMNIARAAYNQGDIKRNQQVYEDLISFLSKSDKGELYVDALLGLGWALREQANHTDALENYLEALRIAKTLKDPDLLARCYGKIAVAYHSNGDHESARPYYDKAIKISLEIGDTAGVGATYNNLGLLYQHLGDLDSARYYFEESGQIAADRNDLRGIAIPNENLGLVYKDLGHPKTALNRLNTSLEIWRSLNDDYGVAQVLAYQMGVYNAMSNYDSTILISREALELSRRAGVFHVEQEVFQHLTYAYENSGAIEDAYRSYKKYVSISDSIERMNTDEKVATLELEHDYQERIYLDSLNNVRNRERVELAAQEQVREERNKQTYMWIGFGVLVLVMGFVLTMLRQKQRVNRIVSDQNIMLQEKNKEVLDSITYAQRIQAAILPKKELVDSKLKDSFTLYKPKDIVAGDFYWMEEFDGALYVAVADCTGHGVPGAMVSVVCANALTRALVEEKITEPGKILDRTRDLVLERFGRAQDDIKDGMDICLVKLQGDHLEYAGANNPLWVVRNSDEALRQAQGDSHSELRTTNSELLHEVKPDKQPIGKHEVQAPFTNHKVEVSKGDTIYMFTDGYMDQFGGERGKKYKATRLREKVLSLVTKPMKDQLKELDREFENWRGDIEQIDDVCVIGIRL